VHYDGFYYINTQIILRNYFNYFNISFSFR